MGNKSVPVSSRFFPNDHIGKADIVPLDYRNLTSANQSMVNSWIKNLTSEQQSKILILR
ncbi:hypothetical protein [Pseudomonas vanderleydeniana]|uniref:CdiA C-terminal tRNase domain-containing protein n=1 Tax=Pseudomonas vanderleydeniana TaxID=2745495 RepID=A0A9E6TTM9_9PSED|nr:hypothetical protein HU752_008365 [Pseudomonas vanderleydeniana]